MKWLILIHVLSAIVGVGPTFFAHVLLRRNQSVHDLRQSMGLMKKMELFPKIGGTITLLTGILLIILGDYGSFLQLWLIGALVIYLYVQIVVIGFAAPLGKKLGMWLFDPANKSAETLPEEQQRLHSRMHGFFWAASVGGVVLFIFMIMKPVL